MTRFHTPSPIRIVLLMSQVRPHQCRTSIKTVQTKDNASNMLNIGHRLWLENWKQQKSFGIEPERRIVPRRESDAERSVDRRTSPGECQQSGLLVHSKRGNLVAPLVACIQKCAAGIQIDLTRIIALCPCFSNPSQVSLGADCEHCDGVVQPVGRVHIRSVGERAIRFPARS